MATPAPSLTVVDLHSAGRVTGPIGCAWRWPAIPDAPSKALQQQGSAEFVPFKLCGSWFKEPARRVVAFQPLYLLTVPKAPWSAAAWRRLLLGSMPNLRRAERPCLAGWSVWISRLQGGVKPPHSKALRASDPRRAPPAGSIRPRGNSETSRCSPLPAS